MDGGTDWYPGRRDRQRVMYGNFRAKIGNYDTIIAGLTHEMIDRLKLICDTYIAIYDGLEMNDATIRDAHEWQKDMERGNESEPVQPPPVFQTITLPSGAFKGFVKEFREMVGLLKKMPGYTQAIGADLMIVPVKGEPQSPETMQPNLKYTIAPDYTVRVAGKMQGMKVVKFYYRLKGEADYKYVGFLTNLPGEIQIAPATPGKPEVGDIRAVFVENNTEVGQFSQSQEITLS